MARFIKHIGQNLQGDKLVVLYREVPGEAENCLVVLTKQLSPSIHDEFLKAIENTTCQSSPDASDWIFRQSLQDGTNMLNTLHQRGWISKVPTKSILMTPGPGVEINLIELNKELKQIANREAIQGISNTPSPAAPPGVITDEALASKYRSQANTFEKEAQRLREEAEKLVPKNSPGVVLESPILKKGKGRPPKLKVLT